MTIFSKKTLSEIAEDLKFIKEAGFWAVLYGSFVSGDMTPRSDIDVAVITRIRDKRRNMDIWWDMLKKSRDPYDIRIFELLPLYIKADIIDNYIVLYGDMLDISEYFYFYRKLWKDQIYRFKSNQFSSMAEKLKALHRFYSVRRKR